MRHKVIFNSDDFGYSRGVNYGIIDAYSKGILTSTTLMANMPGFQHAIALKKQHPHLGVGVHLTLTCGKPLLANKVPSLVNGENFHPLNFYDCDFKINPDELFAEWDAQINKVIQTGIQPTHLDSHHHTHTMGGNQEIVIELSKKYNLPVRGNFQHQNRIKHVDYFEPFFDDVGSASGETQTGLPLETYLNQLLDQIKSHSSTEIMCHTAYLDLALLEGSSFQYPRLRQVEFMIHSEFANKIRHDPTIQLIHYGEL